MAILCGTDFSECAKNALSVAALLASRFKDPDLWLVHVLDPAIRALAPEAQAAVRESAQARLEGEARELRSRTSAEVHPVALAGPTSSTLLEFAEARQVSLVVVASQGHSASPVFRLGGTSERLAQSSPLPVLVVRDAAPYEAWARGERALRVLLAVDWTRSSEPAIRWVKALREAGSCNVVVGYVYYSGWLGDDARRYGLSTHSSPVEREPETERLLVRDLAARMEGLGGDGELVVRPIHGLGRLGDHILHLAEAEAVDLVVLGTHHKRGLGRLSSVAAVTLHHSHASVATVPLLTDGALAPEEVPRIDSVLIATDLSPVSNHAIPFGYSLFGDRSGEAFLIHVLPEGILPGRDEDAAAQLRTLVPTQGLSEGVVTRTRVIRHPDAARAICEAAERLGVDAICIGATGLTGVKRALLGSVAEAVLRKSRQPVFVVPAPPE